MAQERSVISVPIFKRLQHGDYTVTPFQAFKRRTFTNANYSSSLGMDANLAIYPIATTFPGNKIPPSASNYSRLLPGQTHDPKVLWYAINNLYYNNKVGLNDNNALLTVGMERRLYGTASVLSIPQRRFGEGIKPGSFQIDDYSSYAVGNYSEVIRIRDDGYGNLYDATLDTSDYVDTDYLYGYWGFNEKYPEVNTTRVSSYVVEDFSTKKAHGLASGGVTFEAGVVTGVNSGVQATFDGASYIHVPYDSAHTIDSNDDYAISLWVELPSAGGGNAQADTINRYNSTPVVSLVSREVHRSREQLSKLDKTGSIVTNTEQASKWPYRIDLNANGVSTPTIFMSRKDASGTEYVISGSTGMNYGQHNHVLCQKSGSNLQVYINGTLRGNLPIETGSIVTNNFDTLFGAYSMTSGRFAGGLDEIRMYKKGLTQAEIDALGNTNLLSGSLYQTNVIGNIYYKNGLVVISDPRPKYRYALRGQTGTGDYGSNYGFSGEVRGVVTIYEHEILCKIRDHEFNFTMNPSIRQNNDDTDDRLKSFVTSSDFYPYVTTVGLYNDKYELLAVGKLASPVPKRSDVDLNIIIRFDT